MAEQKAQLRYLRIAPRKVRLLTGLVQGLSVNEAEAMLLAQPQRAARPLLKLLRSAVSNAKNNQKLDPTRLFVQNIRVDGGPILKRFLPRARGMATPLQKKMSHVTLVLHEMGESRPERFSIVVPKKTKDKELAKPAQGKAKKPALPEEQQAPAQPKEKQGILKRVFRRKSV